MSTPALSELSPSEYTKDIDSPPGKHPQILEFDVLVDPCTQQNSTIWWKIDLFILPVATLIFFLSFLDRSNIGNARVAGLQQQLNMSDYQYTVAMTITYVPYILVEIPSNLLLKRVGPNILLPMMLTLWGLVATMHGLITSYSGLIACRFFLGLCEGGLLPGLSLYLAGFYPRRKLQLRIAVFFTSSSLAGGFSGLLSTAIVRMEGIGGRPGWAWIFILEGLFTFICGLFTFLLMPETPSKASFLTSDEKKYVVRCLRQDGMASGNEQDDFFNWIQVRKTLAAPQVLILVVAGFFNGATLFGLANFLPTIISSLGYTANRAQLMSVPPFAASFVLSVITSFMSDLYGRRGLTISFSAIISIAGFAMFLVSDDSRVRYGALFLLLPGTYCCAPPLAAWIANNTAPHVRRATSIAFLTTLTNSGGILSTWLLGTLSPGPKYTKASITFLIFQVGILVCAQLNLFYLTMRNRRKAEIRAVASSNAVADAEHSRNEDDSPWFEYTL